MFINILLLFFCSIFLLCNFGSFSHMKAICSIWLNLRIPQEHISAVLELGARIMVGHKCMCHDIRCHVLTLLL
jgi:hypothetical protein